MDWILLLALAAVPLLVVAVVVVAVVFALSRRHAPLPYGPAHRPTFSTPLERAQATASELTPEEWIEFRRWVEGRTLPPSRGEGITR